MIKNNKKIKNNLYVYILSAGLFGLTSSTYAGIKNEVLVKFKKGYELYGEVSSKCLGGITKALKRLGVLKVKLPENITDAHGVQLFNEIPEVEYVEPNFVRVSHSLNKRQKFKALQDEPYLNDQWNLRQIGCEQGWEITKGKRDVIIAILDTGVDIHHKDLTYNLVPGYNAITKDLKIYDINGHGTHCAGIIGADVSRPFGVFGVAPECSIMPVKVLGDDGLGYIDWIAEGITYAVDHGAKILSMSFGSNDFSRTEKKALDYAWSSGALMVASAGNHGNNKKNWPAAYERVISVASLDQKGKRAKSSNHGKWVDVAAPGKKIYSTVPGGYGYKSGTSMACPHVSGLAGLIWSVDSKTTNSKVKKNICEHADDLGDEFIYGRINVRRSLEHAVQKEKSQKIKGCIFQAIR